MNGGANNVRKRTLKRRDLFGFSQVYVNIGSKDDPEMRELDIYLDPNGFIKGVPIEKVRPYTPDQVKENDPMTNSSRLAVARATVDQL